MNEEISSPSKDISILGIENFETYRIDSNTIGVRPKWISVNKKFPEQYAHDLISDGEIVTTSHFQDGYFVGKEIDISVTHWFPLPKPPEV